MIVDLGRPGLRMRGRWKREVGVVVEVASKATSEHFSHWMKESELRESYTFCLH